MFTYYPKCKNILSGDDRHCFCSDCGFDFYFNPAPAAGVIIVNDKDQIYLGLRTRDPKAGCWEIPGGFININESAEEGAIREIKEELGIDLIDLAYFRSCSNDYFYKGMEYHPLDIFFIAKVNLREIKPTDDEFAEGKFFDIDKIPFDKLAFKSNLKVLGDFISSVK
jgi:NAD+ diphosphatase